MLISRRLRTYQHYLWLLMMRWIGNIFYIKFFTKMIFWYFIYVLFFLQVQK